MPDPVSTTRLTGRFGKATLGTYAGADFRKWTLTIRQGDVDLSATDDLFDVFQVGSKSGIWAAEKFIVTVDFLPIILAGGWFNAVFYAGGLAAVGAAVAHGVCKFDEVSIDLGGRNEGMIENASGKFSGTITAGAPAG